MSILILARYRPGCVRSFDRAAGVHHHSGHVHVQVEFQIADIDQLAVPITKLDHELVAASAKATRAA